MEHHRQITPHLGLPLLIIAVLLALQTVAPAPPLAYVLTVLVGAVAAGYYWAREMATKVSLERERRYGWAQVGDVVEERFALRNASWLPVLWAEIRDHSTLPGYTSSRVTGADGHSTTRWVVEGECRRRGVFMLGPIDVRMSDPLGLFTVSLRVGEQSVFVVYPVIAALPALDMPRGAAPGHLRASLRAREATPSVSSVRPYAPGDPSPRIHWPTTARRGELYVKDHDREPAGDLWILLDLQAAVQAGEGEFSTVEYGITLAASLADAMLRQNRAVGLLCDSGEYTLLAPQRGQAQLWRILRSLAAARPAGRRPFGELIGQSMPALGHGLAATLITPSTDPEWLPALVALQQHSIAAGVFLLDPTSFGGQGNVQAMLALLSARGVAVQVIDKGYRFRPLVQRRRQRPTYKVLSTGRVIAVPPV